ncbi:MULTISPECIES: hypothetical protein [unclassified Lysobacter]|uniref:hypothetical protein n=1 Tax=unclassified Lysobacter TaxID=2635362 RepID=UPI0012F945F5|nr:MULTISPECIES: hypothetical protein [unclassified Lysobacter]
MSSNIVTSSDLYEHIDAVLSTGYFDENTSLVPQAAIAFCRLLWDSLDATQRDGVAAAQNFLNGKEESYAIQLNVFSRRIDQDPSLSEGGRPVALNRLVWTALNANTGLSDLAGEFLVELGLAAGLSPEQIATVFADLVPGFEQE